MYVLYVLLYVLYVLNYCCIVYCVNLCTEHFVMYGVLYVLYVTQVTSYLLSPLHCTYVSTAAKLTISYVEFRIRRGNVLEYFFFGIFFLEFFSGFFFGIKILENSTWQPQGVCKTSVFF